MSDHIQRADTITAHQLNRYVVNVARLILKWRVAIREHTCNAQLAVPDARPVNRDFGCRTNQNNATTLARERNRIRDRAFRAHRVVDERWSAFDEFWREGRLVAERTRL